MSKAVTIIVALVAAFCVTCILAVGILIWRAPEGYEDGAGFHLGKAPDMECDEDQREDENLI